MFRLPYKTFATFIAAFAVAACADSPSSAPKPAAGKRAARIGFAPVFSKTALAAAARLADFGLDFNRVRVVIVKPPADTVKDTTITFVPGQADVTLDLTVDVDDVGESFGAAIDYTGPSGVVFHGEGTVTSHAPDQPAPPQDITVNYAGPGATVTHIAVSPKTASIVAPGSATFTVAAFDATNAPVSGVPVSWTSSDPTIATISNSGTLTATGKRGTVTVTASTPTNATDNATATISLPASSIVLVSGGGQTGKVGSTLPLPAVVRVLASDGGGVPGISVNFAAPVGGKVGAAFVTTDGSGSAAASLTLGSTVGPQGFAAVAAGFSVSISATATAGDAASVNLVSGDAQSDTVKRSLKLPLVVKVADQFGNPLSGVTVTWTRTAGGGTLGSPTSTTAADGTANVSYTLGSVAGSETITASAAGVAGAVTFTEQAIAGPAATIVAVSGGGQTARISTPLAPFVLKVNDVAGNPVKGATVTWTATNGTFPSTTTTTDATGTTSNTMTLGAKTGPASATATAGAGALTFTATVTAGIVAKVAFQTQPTTTASAISIAPPVQIALQDAGGNATAATNAVTIAFGTNPSSGTLTGTLTRAAVGGVATFDDLKIDKAGIGYTLVATSAGTPGATSDPFSIGAGAPAGLTIVAGDAQTAIVNTAVAVSPAVLLKDLSGNVIAGATVTFTPASGSGSVAPSATVTTNSLGIATLPTWTLGTVSGTQSLVVSTAGVANVTLHATATPAAATTLSMAVQPSVSAGSGIPFITQPVIQLRDAFGNASPTSGVTVTAALSSGGGTLGGTLTAVTDALGQATFTNLKVNGLVGTRTIGFTATGLSPVTSAPVAIVAGTADKLAFTAGPTTTTAAATITPAVVVTIQDADGNTVTGAGSTVSLAITAGTGSAGASLGGTASVAASSGVATFSALNISKAGSAYSLTATSSGLTSAVSSAFDINPGSAAGLSIFAGDAQTATVNTAVSTSPSVKLVDGSGNAIAGATVTFTPASGSGSVTPTSVATNALGVATVTSWTLGTVAGSQSMTASYPGLPTVTFHATATAGPASTIVILVEPPASVQDGVTFPTAAAVQVVDAFSNASPTSGMVINAHVTSGGGTLGGTVNVNTDATGRATFSNLQLNGTTGAHTLGFQSFTLVTTITSTTVNLTPGPAAKLAFQTEPTNTGADAIMSPVVVRVTDADNNTVTTTSPTIGLLLNGAPPSTILSGATGVTSIGTSTFSGLSINVAGAGYTLTASSAGLTSATSTAFNILPSLSSMTPTVADAVFLAVPVSLTGAGFVSGDGIVTTSPSVISSSPITVTPTNLTANFIIAGGTTTTTFNVSVATLFGSIGTLPFSVYSIGTAPQVLGAAHGGPGGSIPYSLDCATGEVATGINARGGGSVDAIQLICQPVTGPSRTFGAASLSAFAGGGGGSPAALSCPANYVMTGLAGYTGFGPTPVNDQISAICTPIAGGASVTTATVGTASFAAYSESCPVGMVMIGIQGAYGTLVDLTQIKCR